MEYEHWCACMERGGQDYSAINGFHCNNFIPDAQRWLREYPAPAGPCKAEFPAGRIACRREELKPTSQETPTEGCYG